MKYFLILGKNKNLCLAEAAALLKDRLGVVDFFVSDSFLVFETDKTVDFWNEFGGSIKFGQILSDIQDIKDIGADIFIKHLDKEKKNFFGISYYKESPTPSRSRTSHQLEERAGRGRNKIDMFKLGMTLKRDFEKSGIKIRLVTSKEETLSSVVVKTNKLLTRGLEAVILERNPSPSLPFIKGEGQNPPLKKGDEGGFFIGKTLAVQEFSDYEFRDYGRPGRDTLSGMIPPKLAKMMLNLAAAKKDSAILDPFCGSGTIITEAAILGYKNLIGTDISERAIDDTNKNIEWVKNNFQFPISNFQIKRGDVREITKTIPPNSVDAIVTEPYLGPPLHGNEREDTIQKIVIELQNLYADSFSALLAVAKKSATMVIVVPRIKIGGKEYIIQFDSGGWQEEKIKSPSSPPLKKGDTGGFISPLIWSRPDQKVIREVRIYKK